jgi:orotate phosphoribosyltransferase-like protein
MSNCITVKLLFVIVLAAMIDKEKYRRAIELRSTGLTYSEVGRRLDMSAGRARQIVLMADLLLKTGELDADLSGAVHGHITNRREL